MKIHINGFGKKQNATLVGYVMADLSRPDKWSDRTRSSFEITHGLSDRHPDITFENVAPADAQKALLLCQRLYRMAGISIEQVVDKPCRPHKRKS